MADRRSRKFTRAEFGNWPRVGRLYAVASVTRATSRVFGLTYGFASDNDFKE